MLKWFLKSKLHNRPKAQLPMVLHRELNEIDKDFSLLWLGHSSIIIDVEGKRLLLDPVFSDYAAPIPIMFKRFQPTPVAKEAIKNIDAILLSHNHYDHCDKKALKYFAKTQPNIQYFVPRGLDKILEKWGVSRTKIKTFRWLETEKFFNLAITLIPTTHFSRRNIADKNKTLWGGWIIKSERYNIFFSGDGGYNGDFKKIGLDYGAFDLALLNIGGYNEEWIPRHHITPEEAIQASLDLKAKAMMPIHWATFCLGFHHWKEPIERATKAALKKNVKLLTPRLGEKLTMNNWNSFRDWWKDY